MWGTDSSHIYKNSPPWQHINPDHKLKKNRDAQNTTVLNLPYIAKGPEGLLLFLEHNALEF